MDTHKKPTGELGSIEVGPGSATYRSQPIPKTKLAIEEWALCSAIQAAFSRGFTLYDLVAGPEQIREDDFDFTLATTRGKEYVELMEVTLMPPQGGYAAAKPWYSSDEMIAGILDDILDKAHRYGEPSRPLHLLLYSTEQRFALHPGVLRTLARSLQRRKHCFASVVYVEPDEHSGGRLETLFPGSTDTDLDQSPRGTSVVVADIRNPEVQEAGSTVTRMPIPPGGSGDENAPESRIWICPALCGCDLEILAQWVQSPIRDRNSRIISYQHPIPGTIGSVQILSVCKEHGQYTSDAAIDDTYGGQRAGYLRRRPVTDGERLYAGLQRYSGQTHVLDTCRCRMHEITDLAAPDVIIRKCHPIVTWLCPAHRNDSPSHELAVENNVRKNVVVNWLKSEYGRSGRDVRWGWGEGRILKVAVRGFTEEQVTKAQAWCDLDIGANRVVIQLGPQEGSEWPCYTPFN